MTYKVGVLLPEIEPFSPVAGAVARWVYETAHFMQDFKFMIFAPYGRDEFRGFPIRHLHSSLNLRIKWLRRIGKKIYPLEAALRIKDCDIIYIHNRPKYVRKARQLSPNSKIVLHMYNDHLLSLKPDMFDQVLKNTHCILAVSKYIANGIIQRSPSALKKVHVLYSGANLNKFHPRVDSKTKEETSVLYTGRLNPDKGVLELIKAMKLVLADFPEAHLKVVGSFWFNDNRLTPYIEKLIDCSKEITDFVEFTGFIPNDKLPEIYASAFLFVAPSIWNEPCGLTVLEAMASGLPIVSSQRGGIPEIVGDAGILVEPEDTVALANAIGKYLKDRLFAKEMGIRARRRVEKYFTWEKTAQGLVQILSDLIMTH